MAEQTVYLVQTNEVHYCDAGTNDTLIFLAGNITSCGVALIILDNNNIVACHIFGFIVNNTVLREFDSKINGCKVKGIWIFTNDFTDDDMKAKYMQNARILASHFNATAEYYVSNHKDSWNCAITVKPVLKLDMKGIMIETSITP